MIRFILLKEREKEREPESKVLQTENRPVLKGTAEIAATRKYS